jgi:LuxR family maltose regulon positive regulatory protein
VVDDFVRLVQATQMSSMMTAVAAVEAHIRLARGEIDAAAGWAASYQPRPDALYYYSKFEYAVFLRVLMAEQRWNEARVWIRRQLDVAEPAGHVETAIELYALQAVAERAQGHHEAALDALDAAITLAAPESYIRVFLDAGLPMAELLGWRAARRSHDDTVAAFVRRLRAAFGTTHDAHRACDELLEPLTAREHEILRLIAAGLSTQEIAARLIVSVGTVKTHLHHLYGKLDARDRTHALVRARELGLVA